MSLPDDAEVKCPKCEDEFSFRIWNTMNVTLDPELEQRLIDGTLTLATCPNCGNEFYVIYETLYHDMERKFMVEFRSPENWNQPKESLGDYDLQEVMHEYRYLRRVGSWDELQEKVMIFASDLDDLVVEVIKMAVLTHEFGVDKPEDGLLWFSGLQDIDGAQKLVFELMLETDDDDEENAVHVPMSLYEQVRSDIGNRGETHEKGEFVLVNQSTLPQIMED